MMRREHAERNEMLCSELLSGGKYHDWAVTTAFYSALHFVQFKMFEMKGGSMPFTTLEEAKAHYRCHSLHRVRQSLIADHFPEVMADYAFLEKNSKTARYLNYTTSLGRAKQAKQRLGNIKKHCCP